MARSGSSSKFVPANLNSSYGQPHHPSSNGSSPGLGRSRSFGSSTYGGMVSLNRSSRMSSSFVTAPASARASKLTVPRPVNLPSLRREHSGNDPAVALVGSSGSSGWTKQTVEDAIDTAATRSDGPKLDSSWGNNFVKSTHGIDGSNRGSSGASTPGHGLPVKKAVVFRGEDFPTLQAATLPYSPSTLPQPRSRGSEQNQQNEVHNEQRSTPDILQQHNVGDDILYSRSSHERHIQSAEPVRMPVRGNIFDQVDGGSIERSGGYARGPSPLIRLAHTSNWADDERETLSSAQMQDRVQSNWSEPNNGFHTAGSWLVGRSTDGDLLRPSSRNGRNDGDLGSSFVAGYNKDRGLHSGGRFEHDHRGEFDRFGRNDFLKRGWSFSAADSNARFRNPSYTMERERDASGRIFYNSRDFRHETSGRDVVPRDMKPGLNYHSVAQGQDSKFGWNGFLGKQGFPGSGVVSPGFHGGRGHDFLYAGSDAVLSGKSNIMRQDLARADSKSERKAASFFGQAHHDNPFLGDGMSPSFYGSSPLDSRNSRMKKEIFKDDLRDPARESFEAELERVEKMMELERQRVAEERERAMEIARKEQEEQERLMKEEEETRRKLEEEAQEAAYRAKREAEEAARKVEEARKAREEEKHLAALEEERRRENARRMLLELEERIAKRESMKRQEDAVQQERGPVVRGWIVDEVGAQPRDTRRGNTEVSMDFHWKSQPSSGKVDPSDFESGASARLPSDHAVTFVSPRSSKVHKGSFTGERLSTWKREALDQGLELQSAEKGKTPHSQNDGALQEHVPQERRPSLRNSSFRSHKGAVLVDMQNMASLDDIEERNWWGRDAPSQSHYPSYADTIEYPPIGRLRQSLPKQPKVLPPPPGQAAIRKHKTQPYDRNHEVSSGFNRHFEEEAPLREDHVHTTVTEVVASHDPEHENSQPTPMQVAQQFDSSPSEEVVLSDAGSQFSDDSLEDEVPPTMQTYQEQELHSDIVSETYTEEEEEVDEMVNLMEAQESSDVHVLNGQMLKGEERSENIDDSLQQEKDDSFGAQDEEREESPEVVNHEDERIEEGKLFKEGRDGSMESESGCLVEEVAMAACENPTKELASEESMDSKDGEPAIVSSDLSSEEGQEIHCYAHPTPFLPVSTGDTGQVILLEGASTRPTLVQQFQQPFSFMAVPLPQSGTLNHVVASPAMLPSVHGLPNHQDIPFHLQLGLLPGVPLLPNAIQIGSIQMPLHIHPQVPQLTHLHGQQAPVFQFGQIGHSVLAHPSAPLTPPAQQVHYLSGQNSSSEHQQNASRDLNTLSNGGDVASLTDVAAGANLAGDCKVPIDQPKAEGWVAKLGVSADQADYKPFIGDKLEGSVAGNGSQADHNIRPSSRPSRGRRSSNVPRYHGILGRGRGRYYDGVQNYTHRAPRIVAENWAEMGARGGARGKTFRKIYRRAEYRVREQLSYDVAADETPSAPRPNMEEYKGYRYVKKGGGSQHKAVVDDKGQVSSSGLHHVSNAGEGDGGDHIQPTCGKEEQPISGREYSSTKRVSATSSSSSRTKGLLRKYEVDTGEDAAFRTGVVRVFEQPGIETPNDKDDFIKVRSKRQLLRELREQREKESKTKAQDMGVPEQVARKQPKPSAKAGRGGGTSEASSSKTSVRRRPGHTSETNGPSNTTSSSGGAAGSLGARNRAAKNLTKSGRATPPSKDAIMDIECLAHENRVNEHSTTAAWGGQRKNQEVVSLTQIQLEEAMKPSRLDAPFPESLHVPEKATGTVEQGSASSSSVAPFEKKVAPVKASSPLSSLLAGEKIQFGAVTSPTVLPANNHLPSPMAVVRTGSPLGFRGDSAHMTSHGISYVGGYSEAHMAATFTSSKGMDSASRDDDGFQVKVVDLEAEAEAAASAVAAAAISSDDSIESHSSRRGSIIAADGQTRSSRLEMSPLSLQSQNISVLNNPAHPTGLSVETPPSFFQGSPMTLSDSSGVVLQSLPSGAPAYSGLEMGPVLGGPAVFSFGPREDTLASMEPRLPNWQQMHVGSPDSFYGAPPPYLSPAGLPSIQGHPHMLVYTNPFTHVPQLGVSFMGAAYNPSDKQPDWTHVPMPSSSLGPLAPIEGDLNGGASGVLTTQHLSGASSSILTNRMQVPGPSMMPLATPSSLFDTGLAAPFQSHWSKAPAPPVHTSPNSEPAPMQNMPMSRPAVDLSMQVHTSKVFSHRPGHLPHSLGVSSSFQQLLVVRPPLASGPFSSVVTCPQLPDELGLMEAIPRGKGQLNFTGGQALSKESLMNSGEELVSQLQSQSQDGTGGQMPVDAHIKAVGKTSPNFHISSSPYAGQRASKHAFSNGSDLSRSSQRKAASGRPPSSLVDSRGGSMTPSKLKQIYIAKPAADSRKLGAACT